jgi:hypothetical protein
LCCAAAAALTPRQTKRCQPDKYRHDDNIHESDANRQRINIAAQIALDIAQGFAGRHQFATILARRAFGIAKLCAVALDAVKFALRRLNTRHKVFFLCQILRFRRAPQCLDTGEGAGYALAAA